MKQMIDIKDIEAEVKPVVQTLHDLANGEDRTTAIIGAAFVENILEEWLRRFLQHGEKTFRAKIKLCFTLGLIGPIAHEDFDLIRKMRNKFAHETLMHDARNQLASVSFKTPQISAWSNNLKLWERVFRPED